MSDYLQRIQESTQRAAVKLHVRSALNPMLWLTAIVSPVCFIFAFVFRDYPELRNLLIYVAIAPIAVTCLGFVGFAIFRPEKLQSEEYQLRHESLQIIQQKAGRISIAPASIEAIANPSSKLLADKEGEHDT